MKILVTDASIFIDLLESDSCRPFFELPYEVFTTYQIWRELEEEQQTILNKWVKAKKLSIIKIEKDFVAETADQNLSKSLSVADLSIWYLCETRGDILLTSDGTLRKMAKRRNLETHGLLWVFGECIIHNTFTAEQAIFKLEMVFNRNIYYRSNQKLITAFEKFKKRFLK